MKHYCLKRFLSVIGAAVGILVASHYQHSMYQADWMFLSYLLFGSAAGVLVAWLIGKGMKCDSTESSCCK